MVDTHHVLIEAAHSLINAGEKNIFTPMHLFVFEKPLPQQQVPKVETN